MAQSLPLVDLLQPQASSAIVELFDPPMCCPTGVCGPTLDQALVDVNEMILDLQSHGIRVARYQMTSNPQAFLGNEDVMRLVRERQMEALPITVVHSHVIKTGAYPTLHEVHAAMNGGAGS